MSEKKNRGSFSRLEQIFSSLHEARGGNEMWIMTDSLCILTIAATVVMQTFQVYNASLCDYLKMCQ